MRPPSLRSAPDRTALAGVGERPRARTCRGTRPPPPRASGKEGAKTRLLADRRGCDPLSGGACHPHVVPAPQLDSCQRQPVASGHTGCLRPREARAQDHMTQRPRGGTAAISDAATVSWGGTAGGNTARAAQASDRGVRLGVRGQGTLPCRRKPEEEEEQVFV